MRKPKGSVSVVSDRGWLRLVWSYAGKRYVMAVGLPDSVTNRAIAEGKAAAIYGDVISGNFDPSLDKYRAQSVERSQSLTVVELFDRWTAYKAKQVETRSLEKLEGFGEHLRAFFKRRAVEQVTEEDCFKFRDWLLKKNKPITVRERLGWLRSAWKWAAKRELVTGGNPWDEVRVKVPPAQPQPFSREELHKILGIFQSQYSHYSD
ncbi:MAG TPA: phage integrase SAM-like domain-containing protein, partial [Chroococcidiopsis sp.]